MKKIILSIIAITFTIHLSAQPNRVKKYYYWINQAELAICDSNFIKANECFGKAFAFHKPLGIHLSTALLMNTTFAKDTARIYQYASQLLLCGDEGIAYRYAHQIPDYDSCIYNRLLFLENNIVPAVDTTLQQKLADILARDQSYQHSFGSNAREDSLNRSVINDIYSVYANYKTLNDYTAGLLFAFHYLKTPAIHYAYANTHTLQDLLKKEVLKCNICADMYMQLEDMYLWEQSYRKDADTPKDPNGYGSVCDSYFKIIGNHLFITYPTDIDKVNRNRKRIGVSESFEDFVKKVVWQYTTGRLFWTSVPICIYGTEEDDKQYAKELIQEIETEHAAGDYHRLYLPIKPKNK